MHQVGCCPGFHSHLPGSDAALVGPDHVELKVGGDRRAGEGVPEGLHVFILLANAERLRISQEHLAAHARANGRRLAAIPPGRCCRSGRAAPSRELRLTRQGDDRISAHQGGEDKRNVKTSQDEQPRNPSFHGFLGFI